MNGIFSSVFCPVRVLEPSVSVSGGGQLHQAGEKSRASIAGMDCQEEYRERNMDV